MIKYSVIVAVYNRLGEVRELLRSAERLTFDRDKFEILFVDDGSKDGFKDFIEHYQSETGLKTRAVFQQNQGPGVARNHGMSVAQGEYFVFVDSDCMFPPHWLSEIDIALSKQHLDCFGGPDTFHPSFSPLLKAINYSMTSFLGTGGTRGSKKSIGKFYPRSFNMGIKREIYRDIGGMNLLRHGQDMDFSARIYAAGYKVGLIPDAFVYHKRRTSIPKFFRQIFNWGVARINLGKLHPALLKPVHFLPALIVLGVVTVFLASLYTGPWLLYGMLGGWLLVCLLAFVQSLAKYRSLKVALLSIITLNIQVFAYGFGVLWALPQMLWKDEASGFTKNYYGKKKG